VLYLIDLFFPPLVTLALGLIMTASVHALAALDGRFATASRILGPVHAAMLATLILYAFSPIPALNLPVRYLMSLLFLPYYVAWKLRIAVGRRPREWVRTPREPQAPA
jgi:hypothetical protein